MKFVYADPPYLGCCGRYGHFHPDGRCWDDVATHKGLLEHLMSGEFEGWALSASSPSLPAMLTLCPPDVRVAAWVKPFASFKPNVNPAYAWEPVMWWGGRSAADRGGREVATVRDWVSAPITLRKGLTGAKPPKFCRWILALLGYQEGDEVVDMFPGTGVMDRVLAQGHLAV